LFKINPQIVGAVKKSLYFWCGNKLIAASEQDRYDRKLSESEFTELLNLQNKTRKLIAD